jgi:Cu+-exporting ATPase
VVFDKTGTLTAAGANSARFEGRPLSTKEAEWLYSLAMHSTHPHAVQIARNLKNREHAEAVSSFVETSGRGMRGIVAGREIVMGSAQWLASHNIDTPNDEATTSIVHVAIERKYRGSFALEVGLRANADGMMEGLSHDYELALLSGDKERDRGRFTEFFRRAGNLQFRQSPFDKLNFIKSLQGAGKTVMMVGDGLNDSGALKQSDVGVAVVEKIGAFSPASDVILDGKMVPELRAVLRFAKGAVRVVRLSFGISALYNIVGVGIAASGKLSPIVCAILMPLSSVTVAGFACAATTWFGGRSGLNDRTEREAK